MQSIAERQHVACVIYVQTTVWISVAEMTENHCRSLYNKLPAAAITVNTTQDNGAFCASPLPVGRGLKRFSRFTLLCACDMTYVNVCMYNLVRPHNRSSLYLVIIIFFFGFSQVSPGRIPTISGCIGLTTGNNIRACGTNVSYAEEPK